MNISTNYSRRELLYILNISKVSGLVLGNLPEIIGIIHQLVPSLSEGSDDDGKDCRDNVVLMRLMLMMLMMLMMVMVIVMIRMVMVMIHFKLIVR
jgi:hypothetical protein